MAITTETVIGRIEVVTDYKFVQVRIDTIIKEDGKEISRSFHRHVLTPDSNISGEDASVQSICNAVWTTEVRSAYETYKTEQANRLINP